MMLDLLQSELEAETKLVLVLGVIDLSADENGHALVEVLFKQSLNSLKVCD